MVFYIFWMFIDDKCFYTRCCVKLPTELSHTQPKGKSKDRTTCVEADPGGEVRSLPLKQVMLPSTRSLPIIRFWQIETKWSRRHHGSTIDLYGHNKASLPGLLDECHRGSQPSRGYVQDQVFDPTPRLRDPYFIYEYAKAMLVAAANASIRPDLKRSHQSWNIVFPVLNLQCDLFSYMQDHQSRKAPFSTLVEFI